MAMKGHNTIVDPWPTRLKLYPGQPGAQEEFDNALASPFSGVERYVEWKWAEHECSYNDDITTEMMFFM